MTKEWRTMLGALLLACLLPMAGAWGQDEGGTSTSTTSTTTTTTTTSATDTQQRTRGAIGFGPIAGWYKAGSADAGRLTGGLAMRLKLGPALGVEGSITYRQEKYGNGSVTASSWPVQVTGLLYPLPMIYGAIGAGWYHTTLSYSHEPIVGVDLSDQTATKFGWHFGGGLELPLGNAAFIADIRYVFLNYDFKQVPGVGTNNDFYVISAGILFGL